MQTQINYNDKNPCHLYYDINIINNDKTGTSPSAPIVFNDTRSDVILKNPSEYFLSVNRFTVDTPSLPLFVPIIETYADVLNNDINTTIYKIGISRGGAVIDQEGDFFPIKFIPQNKIASPPSLDSVRANNIQEYYYLNSFEGFIDLINTSTANYLGNVSTRGGNLLASSNISIPQWSLDTSTNRASIYFPQNGNLSNVNVSGWGGNYALTGNTNNYYLYLNAPLYNLFSSFNAEYVQNLPLTNTTRDNNGWYRLNINPVNSFNSLVSSTINKISPENNNLIGLKSVPASSLPLRNLNFYPSDRVTYFSVLTQDYATTPLWSPVQAIVFTTALMPVTNELTGIPNVFNDNFNGFNNGGNNRNVSPVLTDIEIPLTRGDEFKPTIYYVPSSEYRLTDLQSNTPINSIQISAFWRDNYGRLHPLLLNAGCTATLKLMFRKKIFNLPSI